MKQFKCRASAIGKIMTKPKGTLTDKQLGLIVELENKKMAKPLTDKQQITLDDLKEKKRTQPVLSATTKTYLQEWYIENRFGKKNEFTNKYTEKGINVEDNAIEVHASFSGEDFIKKNEKHFENDFITGTPDLILKDSVDDIKSSWNIFTFPMFDDPESALYQWQLDGYMWLTGKEKARLVYVLVDTPPDLIMKEIDRTKWNAVGTLSPEQESILEEEIENNMTFDEIEEKYRVRIFHYERSSERILKIQQRIKLCRDYIKDLHADMESR